LLEPHSAPELGTSLPPSCPPPEEGGLVVVVGLGLVVVGDGLVVLVAGLVVGGRVVVGGLDDTSVEAGSCIHGSAASLPNPSMAASEEPTRQSQLPEDSA
jgi:hypothetical protein